MTGGVHGVGCFFVCPLDGATVGAYLKEPHHGGLLTRARRLRCERPLPAGM